MINKTLQKTFKNKIAAMNMKLRFLPITVFAILLAVSGTMQKAYSQDDYNNDNNNSYSQNDNNYQGDENYQGNEEPLIQPAQDVTFDQFYSDLSPYGRWIDNPSYGRVWISNINGFRPYYTG